MHVWVRLEGLNGYIARLPLRLRCLLQTSVNGSLWNCPSHAPPLPFTFAPCAQMASATPTDEEAAAKTFMIGRLMKMYTGMTEDQKKLAKDYGTSIVGDNSVSDTIGSFITAAEKLGVPSVYTSVLLEMIPVSWSNSAVTDDATRVMLAACQFDTLTEAAKRANRHETAAKLASILKRVEGKKGTIVRVCSNVNCTDPACPNKTSPNGVHVVSECTVVDCPTCATTPMAPRPMAANKK